MRAILAAAIIALPIAASAQDLQPVTLTPQEFSTLLNALAARDPLIAALLQKQADAQKAAQKPADKPDNVAKP